MESIESFGFHVIQVSFDETTTSPHSMFIKRHSLKSTDNNNNTLFVVNVPCYCNKVALENIFMDCGPIDSIHIRERPGSCEDSPEENGNVILNYIKKVTHTFKVAYITFENPDSIDIALQMSSDAIRYMSTNDKPVLTGMEKWIKQYADRYPDKSLIQNDADKFMKLYDEKEAKEKEALADSLKPDEDGWVTIPVKNKVLNKKEGKEKRINKKTERKKRTEKELQNFYLFQQREAKRDKIAKLRQQFEEDKKRIAHMQQLRKFKPFS